MQPNEPFACPACDTTVPRPAWKRLWTWRCGRRSHACASCGADLIFARRPHRLLVGGGGAALSLCAIGVIGELGVRGGCPASIKIMLAAGMVSAVVVGCIGYRNLRLEVVPPSRDGG